MTILSTKQKQFLKGLAHHLSPVVMLGGNGLTEGVLAEIDNALNHHELIKVKIAGADRETKQLIIDAIVRETKSSNVQTIGHILVLYRSSEEAKIQLSDEKERALAIKLLQFEEAVQTVGKEGTPHVLCAYLYELAGVFSSFYEHCPILNAEDESVKLSRLKLASLTEKTLKQGLALLGIKTIEKM